MHQRGAHRHPQRSHNGPSAGARRPAKHAMATDRCVHRETWDLGDASREPDSLVGLLRRHRRQAGLTQEDLAERAGLSAKAISALERGERRPRARTLLSLARALNLSAEEREVLLRSALPPGPDLSQH